MRDGSDRNGREQTDGKAVQPNNKKGSRREAFLLHPAGACLYELCDQYMF